MVIKSDASVDALVTSPCSDVVAGDNDGPTKAVDSDMHGHEDVCSHDESVSRNLVKYGELIILGYNGHLAHGDRGRRRSKFMLYKRSTPNGVKRSKHYVVRTPHSTQAILNTEQHSISYTMSRNQAVIVEYTHDENTDMFQIGRSSESPIDFVVLDTVAGDKNKAENNKVLASTISRFACRILCDRNNPSIARIYAAGFDSSKNIFLGEKATKWETGHDMDGLTTNGVLIMHPNGCFSDGNATYGTWREVSIGGAIYSLRASRSAPVKGNAVEGVSNVLQDGTLIDLCGATLLWRTVEGLKKSPTKEYLEELVDKLNADRPVCPVGLNTLVIPRRSGMDCTQQQPYVYLSCGHVQGHHDWGLNKDSNFRTCPMCLKVGRAVKLCMGIEPAFYVDCGPPVFFAFDPCGHMATEKTVKFIDLKTSKMLINEMSPFEMGDLYDYDGDENPDMLNYDMQYEDEHNYLTLMEVTESCAITTLQEVSKMFLSSLALCLVFQLINFYLTDLKKKHFLSGILGVVMLYCYFKRLIVHCLSLTLIFYAIVGALVRYKIGCSFVSVLLLSYLLCGSEWS